MSVCLCVCLGRGGRARRGTRPRRSGAESGRLGNTNGREERVYCDQTFCIWCWLVWHNKSVLAQPVVTEPWPEGHTATGKRTYRRLVSAGSWPKGTAIRRSAISGAGLRGKKNGTDTACCGGAVAGGQHGHWQAATSPAGQCWQLAGLRALQPDVL